SAGAASALWTLRGWVRRTLQRQQVIHEVGDLLGREVELRHHRAGLHSWRVLDPFGQVRLVHRGQQPTRDARLARDIRELGSDLAAGARALDGVAARARERDEELAAALRLLGIRAVVLDERS